MHVEQIFKHSVRNENTTQNIFTSTKLRRVKKLRPTWTLQIKCPKNECSIYFARQRCTHRLRRKVTTHLDGPNSTFCLSLDANVAIC